MGYVIIRDICTRAILNGNSVELFYRPTDKCIGIYPYLLQNCRHQRNINDISLRPLSELIQEDWSNSDRISQVINLEYIHSTYISSYQRCHVAMEMLDMVSYPSMPEIYEKILPKKEMFSYLLSSRNHIQIQNLKSRYIYLIGAQFYTQTDGHYIYDSNTKNKSVSQKTAQKFIDLCIQQNIGVLLLTPTSYTLKNIYDYSYLSIGLLFGIISQMDAVVGIDSVGTHIAGIMRIPNLTIWKRYHPLRLRSPNGGRHLCYRPVSMNYSLVVSDSQEELELAERMFSITQKILTDKISLYGGVSACGDSIEKFI